jgi:hypothetical protein
VAVNVDEVMRGIEEEVRSVRRQRLLAHGAAADYTDPRLYAIVDATLRRAIDGRDHDALLLSELAAGEDTNRLATHLRFASHRSRLGPIVVFAKRRLLLPAMRWLYEYSLNNFRRQDRLNRIVFACLEELAIENARLRLELQDCRIAGLQNGDKGIAGLQDGEIAGLQDGGIAGLQDGEIAGSPSEDH